MKVNIFGGTGSIGQLATKQLLSANHNVTIYARNPAKCPEDWKSNQLVTIIQGELSDAEAVSGAIKGADAVINGNRNIVSGMKKHGVKRYIGLGTPSVIDERDQITLQVRFIGFLARTFLSRAYQEMVEMSKIIMESDLEWTIVRFISPNDSPMKGNLRVGFFGKDSIGFSVTRDDVATFTVQQLSDDTYIRAAPCICN